MCVSAYYFLRFKRMYCEWYFVLFSDTEMTLKEWRVFECMPIFKVLLVAGMDFVSLYRSWAVFAIVCFSLLYTVLVKHIGEV